MYSGLPSVDSYASGKEVVNVKLPSVSALTSSEADDDMEKQVVENSGAQQASSFSISNKQIPELVTLSLLPKSQWQSLINLDIIKVCIFSPFSTSSDVVFFCSLLPFFVQN